MEIVFENICLENKITSKSSWLCFSWGNSWMLSHCHAILMLFKFPKQWCDCQGVFVLLLELGGLCHDDHLCVWLDESFFKKWYDFSSHTVFCEINAIWLQLLLFWRKIIQHHTMFWETNASGYSFHYFHGYLYSATYLCIIYYNRVR